MDITKDNFEEFLTEFKELLPQAEFIAFDTELTGIRKPDDLFFDLPEERFHKMRKAANRYNIIQVGICLFLKQEDQTYQARPYNIYVFPQEYRGYSHQVIMDVSAIEFNKRHSMNFNKWIHEGVGYIDRKRFKKYRSEIEAVGKVDDQPFEFKNPDDKRVADVQMDLFNDWYKGEDKEEFIFYENSAMMRKYYYGKLTEYKS